MLFSMLAAVLLLSALPAFSGSGPFGSFGPAGNIVMEQGIETSHALVDKGTGPYGAYGLSFKGVENTRTDVARGSGPYGVFGSSGMVPIGDSHQIANKDDCLSVVKNCP
jgi:hypothetical protein